MRSALVIASKATFVLFDSGINRENRNAYNAFPTNTVWCKKPMALCLGTTQGSFPTGAVSGAIINGAASERIQCIPYRV